MDIILPSNSLISSIAALSISDKTECKITIKNENINSFGRLYSINYFSKNFLEELGIWQSLDKSKITPYKKIEIYKNSEKTIEFSAHDVNVNFLGYIINENDLVKNISNKISSCHEITKSDKLTSLTSNNNLNIISNYKDVCSGTDSINFISKDYSQTAINITFKHSKKNLKIPRQIFHDDEILGLLPIDEYQYNLIWSIPNKFFKKIESSSNKEYENLIGIRTKFLLGNISDIEVGGSFPLSSRHANEYYYKNCLLIGDSAHKYHPLAGLGLNMGIEDIATVTSLISSNYDMKKMLNEYSIKRMSRNHGLQKLLNIIIHFHSSKIISQEYQIKILKLFNKSIFLKLNIIRNATGLEYLN